MPVLSNPRQELFAQGLLLGKKQDDAYADAGYIRNKGNSSTLKNKPEIQNRVRELLEERADVALKKTAREIEVTKDSLLEELEEARQIAIEEGQASAAVAATIGKARITGNIIDRREVGDAGAFDHLSDEELVALAAKKARELGLAGPHWSRTTSQFRPGSRAKSLSAEAGGLGPISAFTPRRWHTPDCGDDIPCLQSEDTAASTLR